MHHKDVFRQIFGRLALRHTKDRIKDELQLPPQKRVVITVPFTQIEEQHYLTMFNQMSVDCGLNHDGSPATEDWDPDSPAVVEKMRNWLIRLRQTCLHPEVGAKNRRALGNGKGPLRTVGEVLEVMIDQNEVATRSEERMLLLSQIRRGQILEHAEHSEEALQIWLHALEAAQAMVQDCRHQLKAEVDRIRLSEELTTMGEDVDADKEVESATVARTGPHRQRLRAAIEIEHMCTFFIANAFYQIKSDETRTKADSKTFHELNKKEESTYEKAKQLRKELLLEAHNKAEAAMSRVNKRVKGQSFVHVSGISPLKIRGGIETRAIFERIDGLIEAMQSQATQLHEWREKTTNLLLLPLVDGEETDLQGDEYETSTKQQDEVSLTSLGDVVKPGHKILGNLLQVVQSLLSVRYCYLMNLV